MTTNAWVIAGGDFDASYLKSETIAASDIVIGVDHGIAHALKAGIVPTVVVGDFDSVDKTILDDERLAGVQRIAYPPRKNHSDLELALSSLSGVNVGCVTLLGVSGGRTDHLMFNWLLPLQSSWNFPVRLIDASVYAHVVHRNYPLRLSATIGQTVSLLPLPEAGGVTCEGLEYPLFDATLLAGSTRGLSNVAASRDVAVSVSSGRLLVFLVRTDTI